MGEAFWVVEQEEELVVVEEMEEEVEEEEEEEEEKEGGGEGRSIASMVSMVSIGKVTSNKRGEIYLYLCLLL
jgi:hypothetical protein